METKLKNELIVALNENIYEFNRIVNGVEKFYNIIIKCFPKIYLDKIYEFEEYFNAHDMTFFTNNLLGSLILQYYDNLLMQSVNLFDTFADNLLNASNDNFLFKTVLLLNKKFVKDYEKICIEAKEFSVEKDIKKVLLTTFKSLQYYQYSPNQIYSKYEELKEILAKLGLYSDKLNKAVFPFVKKNEERLEFLYESVIEEIGTNDENEIRNYIDNFVFKVKQELEGKQKHI